MALGFIARAMTAGLAKLGEASSLNGVSCGNVSVQRDVTIDAGIGDNALDNPVLRFDTASILASYDPKVGQTLVHPDGTFKLDRLVEDNRYVRRFIIVGA